MATTSMHKPGWRSRRRSRLSLVERAVPRLGHLSQQDERADETDEIDERAGLPSIEMRQADSDLEKPEAESVAASPDSDRPDDFSDSDSPSDLTSGPQSDSLSAQDHDDQQSVALTAAEDQAIDDQITPSEITASPDTADNQQPPAASAISEIASGSNATEPPSTSMAAATNVPSSEPTFTAASETPDVESGPRLSLEWDRLVENGFVDPRDRSQPLPASMEPIIRALIRQALSDQSSWRDRIILVTSAQERTSKSTAAINFAFGLTKIDDHRAVLVDTDSTGQGAVDRLGGHDLIGITDALGDESVKLDDLVIRTDVDRLTLVASGARDDDLVDHLASRRMLQILRHLTESPETILVIDAPPILLSQEAAVLSVVAGQVVLAVEAGRTTADQIEHALQRIGDRHNVSLVLTESSGMPRKRSRSAARRKTSKKTARTGQSAKRHLSKVAATAAAVLALGLLFQQFQAEAAPDQGASTSKHLSSSTVIAEPERWPNAAKTNLGLCRQMCR